MNGLERLARREQKAEAEPLRHVGFYASASGVACLMQVMQAGVERFITRVFFITVIRG